MNKKYKKPPIQEVVVEFEFTPGNKWDMTIPGLIYEKVRNDFPERKEQAGIGIQFQKTKEGFAHKVSPAPPRIQFYRKDGTALLQVAPNILIINQLKPYPSWKKLKPMVDKIFKIYKKVASPKGFKAIRLRYINKINTSKEELELNEYFNLYPEMPENIAPDCSGFITRIEIPYQENRDHLLITMGSSNPEDPNKISIVLDLDYLLYKPESIPLNNYKEWLEQAHSAIEDTFESCITEKTRNIFKEEK